MKRIALILAASVVCSVAASAEPVTLVAWAPGYPGTTEQAQPSMDEFAAGVAGAAGWDAGAFRAAYYPGVEQGRERVMDDAALALVPLPVYLEYGESLGLHPLLRVIQEGGDEETWSLVARKGAVGSPADLSGWTIRSLAGFSPRFVRTALASWGTLPGDTEIGFDARVLSVLRKAAAGEDVAALLDRAQSAALPRLPFAADLEIVATSAPMVSSVLCEVGDRLPSARREPLIESLLSLESSAAGAEVLTTIRVVRFARLDTEALAGVRRTWGDAAD
jgi:hypothetical protein